MNNNSTKIEIPYLPKDFNLTDGHAYRKWSESEEQIINNAATYLKTVNRQQQQEIENNYVSSFFNLTKQTFDTNKQKYLQSTSASLAMEFAANYLRMNKLSLALVEPCFDNLADIFKRHDIPLVPFSDTLYSSTEFITELEKINSDAICIVTPNNPTGNTITKENFLALVNFCKKNKKVLIIDFCFRAYLPAGMIYDQYKMLIDSGIDYIAIEDTGKTWPTVELKAPFIAVSNSLFEPLYRIYTDFFLHVSPFTLKLITEFVLNSQKDNLEYIHKVVSDNRLVLNKYIKNTILTSVEHPFMAVAWLKVDKITGEELKNKLDEYNVHILPGNHFYWSNHKAGVHFVRIALVRDRDVFEEAAKIIGDVCKNL